MEAEVKKKQPIKHQYVIDEFGNVVNANTISEKSKNSVKYFIEGINTETGEPDKEEVIHVNSTKNQKHFRVLTDKKGEVRKRVALNPREYNETIIHKLAKQMILNREIKRIRLPKSRSSLGKAQFSGSDENYFIPTYSEVEKSFSIDNTSIRLDVYCNGVTSQLGIEILVNHKVDDAKIAKLSRLGIDTIEIDLSYLVSDKIMTGDLAEKIVSAIEFEIVNKKWLYNTNTSQLESLCSNLVSFELNTTTHNTDTDGDWYIWAADKYFKIPNCPYQANLIPSSSYAPNRYLTETKCKSCTRFLGTLLKDGSWHMICNQSKEEINNALVYILSETNSVDFK